MDPHPLKALLALVCGVLCGIAHFVEWLPIFQVRNAPVVAGVIVARQPIYRFGGIPGAEFTIQIESGATVCAQAQRYLLHKVPRRVRFRYSGVPTREVFLFDHEENPLWIFLFCWGGSLFLTWYLWRSAGLLLTAAKSRGEVLRALGELRRMANAYPRAAAAPGRRGGSLYIEGRYRRAGPLSLAVRR
jgi:hypothetical protein